MITMKTLQIATVGEDVERTISGVKNFPVQKLVLIAYQKHEEICRNLKMNLSTILRMEVGTYFIANEDVPHEEMFVIIDEILSKNKDFDIIVNVGGGDKFLTCAAVASAFLNGLKAFHCKDDSHCMILPVLKLGYARLISEAKVKILQAIEELGEVKNLRELSKLSCYSVNVLSYHISSGAGNLSELGLVETERGQRGGTMVRITSLGRMIAKKRLLTVSNVK
jgi:hypothetical protein